MERIPVRYLNAGKKEPALSDAFSIRCIQELLDGKDMVQELHRHDFYYILALDNASGSHNIDFTPYAISNHSVFFIRPGQVHQLVLKAGSAGYLLQFRNEFYFQGDKSFNHLLHKAGRTNHYQFSAEGFKKLPGLLTYIFQEFTEKKERYDEVIRANLGVFFIELTRQQSSMPAETTTLYVQEQLEKFLELLEANIFTHKQVAQYAEMLNISVYQLNAIVKTALGKTSSELINGQIILEAKRCLLATSNQVNQTAYRLGYEDVSYFIRFFKKHTGYSPEAFRHNFK